MNLRNKAILLCACCTLAACTSTVTPRIVSNSFASWDGTNQNSGFIGYQPRGSGEITSHARDRYNELIAIFGSRFLPPLKPDAGLTATGTNTFLIDAQHLDYFATMNRWHKQGVNR